MRQQAKPQQRVLIRCLVDPETRAVLDEVAKRWGWTRSRLIREAIRLWLSATSTLPTTPAAPPGRTEEGRWLTLERF